VLRGTRPCCAGVMGVETPILVCSAGGVWRWIESRATRCTLVISGSRRWKGFNCSGREFQSCCVIFMLDTPAMVLSKTPPRRAIYTN